MLEFLLGYELGKQENKQVNYSDASDAGAGFAMIVAVFAVAIGAYAQAKILDGLLWTGYFNVVYNLFGFVPFKFIFNQPLISLHYPPIDITFSLIFGFILSILINSRWQSSLVFSGGTLLVILYNVMTSPKPLQENSETGVAVLCILGIPLYAIAVLFVAHHLKLASVKKAARKPI